MMPRCPWSPRRPLRRGAEMRPPPRRSPRSPMIRHPRPVQQEDPMTQDDNKAIVRRFVDEIFVGGRHETVDELLADDFVAHTWPSTGRPKDDLKAAIDRAAAGLS